MRTLAFLITSGLLAAACTPSGTSENLTEYVDTRVGTASATTQTAGLFGKGSEEHGQTIPAVGVPHGMNLWTPQTRSSEAKCVAPYYYADSTLSGFRNSHWIVGGCTQDYGTMTLTAESGRLRTATETRATPFSHDAEIAQPDYYFVALPAEGIDAEMTGLSRAAIFNFTYTEDGTAHLVVNSNTDEGEGYVAVDPERRLVYGCNPVHRIYQGWGQPAGFSGYFVVQLDPAVSISAYGTFAGDSIIPGSKRIDGKVDMGAYFTFDVSTDETVGAKAASSFTSVDAAVANLDAEIPDWDFDGVRAESQRLWNERLGRIRVEGGDYADRRKFYGSLYRASLLPRVVNDVDGTYAGFAGSGIRKLAPGEEYYDDFSMWDTYRALHPLLTLIEPERSGRMMQSLVMKAEQGGWMPIFPCWNSYTAAMIGDHCAVAIADAAAKGVGNFDLEKAYRYLRQNAFDSPASFEEYADGMGRRALRSYLSYGYIPMEDSVKEAFHKNEQTSRTLEYALDDYALAQIALRLGHEEDAAELLKRSENWRNVIDPELGYANGRQADGTFASGTDPFDFESFITEGAPCHYTWYVPQNIEGLVEVLGGQAAFEAKLDSMFTCRRYWHGNEPCHQVAYLYDYIGRPEKTAARIRHILDTEYLDEPGGLSGNDDAGQMSAWYVFSAMGLYPVCPSKPEYALSEPVFDAVTITPEGGKPFTIRKKEGTVPGYVPFLKHDAVKAGGELTIPVSRSE